MTSLTQNMLGIAYTLNIFYFRIFLKYLNILGIFPQYSGLVFLLFSVLSEFFHGFPFWFPLLFFYPFLSLLLLTNQAPMISIKRGTGTVFVLSLISENIRCTRQVFVFILGYYKLRISAVPARHYLLLAPVFE